VGLVPLPLVGGVGGGGGGGAPPPPPPPPPPPHPTTPNLFRRVTDGIRTRDVQDHNLALYQLSYGYQPEARF
jgi:hypothetical protein